MNIAVVDDNAPERQTLSERVRAALARRGRKEMILEYADSDSFLRAARESRFDLVFLDIYMEGMDGVTAAEVLRSFDPDCVLVFTTYSLDHALDGYRLRALQYLVKPYAAAEVERLFDELDKRLPAPEQVIEVREGRRVVPLRAGDILWAEHFQHQVHIHRLDGAETITRMTFTAFADLLKGDPRFFICGRGVLVNLARAADFDGTAFTLEGGGMVPVSRSMIDAARRAFCDYLFQKEAGM